VDLLFNETFRHGQIDISTVHTVKRFEQTVYVKNRAKPGRSATAISSDKALNVFLSFVEDLHNSICDVARQHDIV